MQLRVYTYTKSLDINVLTVFVENAVLHEQIGSVLISVKNIYAK